MFHTQTSPGGRRHEQVSFAAVCLLTFSTGCVGTLVKDLSKDQTAPRWSQIGEEVAEVQFAATLSDGSVLDGTFEEAPGDSLRFRHEGLDAAVVLGPDRILLAERSGCTWCAAAGSLLGLFAGGAVVMAVADGELPPMYAVPAMAAGAIVGGTAAGLVFPDRRYVLNQLPAGLDTLYVMESRVISVTSTRVRVSTEEGPVSYNRAVVQTTRRGSSLMLIRPAPRRSE